MANFTPAEVSGHPALHRLVAIGLEIASAQSEVNAGTSRDQRRAYTDRANALSARVKRAEKEKDDRAAAELGELLGLSESDVRDLTARAHNGAKQFLEAFPSFRSEDVKTRTEVLIEAVRSDPAVAKAAGDLVARAAADGGESPETCKVMCLLFYLMFLGAAIAMFIAALVACAGIGWIPPLAVLCVIAATAAFGALLAILTDIYLGCLANCVDVPWGD